MDYRRANEIINSLGVINVFHKGQPIWIAELHPENQMAEIKNSKEDQEYRLVSIAELTE